MKTQKVCVNEQKIWHNLQMSGTVFRSQSPQMFQASSLLLVTAA